MGALIEKSTLTEHKVYFVDYIIKVVLERVNIFFHIFWLTFPCMNQEYLQQNHFQTTLK